VGALSEDFVHYGQGKLALSSIDDDPKGDLDLPSLLRARPPPLHNPPHRPIL
jgi:hypothetical protein